MKRPISVCTDAIIGPLYCTVIGSLTCEDISGWKTN